MGILHIDTGGNAANSGSTDDTSPITGTAATVAGSVVTLDGSPNLSGLITSGANQSAINLASATNSNKKIFWITAFDDTAKTVTVDTAPTGIGGTTTWRIGGRHVWTKASIEAAVRAGDIAEFNNSPGSSAANIITARIAGDSTSGPVTYRGKAGTRPVLTVTSTPSVINDGGLFGVRYENLEVVQQGASGNAGTFTGNITQLYNVKVSDGGAHGLSHTTGGWFRVIGCEITGVLTDGINVTSAQQLILGNYIHDVPGDGFENSSGGMSGLILNNIIDTCAARGVYLSAAVSAAFVGTASIIGNTIYGCGDSGVDIVDQDQIVITLNNILQDNGNAAGESNIEWEAGAAEYVGFHGWNLLYNNSGADAPIGFTVNAQVAASELTTNPQMTNPAAGDFTLGSSSSAKATGFPGQFLGGPLGYMDMGAVQRQESGSGGVSGSRIFTGF